LAGGIKDEADIHSPFEELIMFGSGINQRLILGGLMDRQQVFATCGAS